jgi:hypothetical protein
MAEIAFAREFPQSLNDHCAVVSWSALQSGDDGTPIELATFADRSVQSSGTFGVGGTVRIEGSINGTDWAPLTDLQGNNLDLTSAKIESVAELVRYLRPRVTAGDGTTSINVHMIMKAVL